MRLFDALGFNGTKSFHLDFRGLPCMLCAFQNTNKTKARFMQFSNPQILSLFLFFLNRKHDFNIYDSYI